MNINFVIETFSVEDGLPLKNVKKDNDGYYLGLPLAVIGTVTRNRTFYDEESIIDQIVKPSPFNLRLTEGNLIGEWGHPIVDFNTNYGKERVRTLDPTKEAITYRRIYSKPLKTSNKIAIFGDGKPSGPYGQYFSERMEDTTRNCAFSLRSITQDNVDRRTGVIYKKIIQLITFDAGVPSGGYKEASKRYASAESLNDYISSPADIEDFLSINKSISYETLKEDEICEIFKASKIVVKKEVLGIVDGKNKIIHNTKTGEKRGLFSSLISI